MSARNKYGVRSGDGRESQKETGGTDFDARKMGDPHEYFKQIGEELRSMYEAGYYSTNSDKDETFQKVLVKTDDRRSQDSVEARILRAITHALDSVPPIFRLPCVLHLPAMTIYFPPLVAEELHDSRKNELMAAAMLLAAATSAILIAPRAIVEAQQRTAAKTPATSSAPAAQPATIYFPERDWIGSTKSPKKLAWTSRSWTKQ